VVLQHPHKKFVTKPKGRPRFFKNCRATEEEEEEEEINVRLEFEFMML